MLFYPKPFSIVSFPLSINSWRFCNYLVDTFDNSLLNRLFEHRNVIDAQCLLCRIECCNVRNRCVKNLVTVLAATAKLAAEPRYAAALRLQVGLNLVSYVNFHKKGVKLFFESLPRSQVPPSNHNQQINTNNLRQKRNYTSFFLVGFSVFEIGGFVSEESMAKSLLFIFICIQNSLYNN